MLRGRASVSRVVLVLLQAVPEEFPDARPVADRVVVVAVGEHAVRAVERGPSAEHAVAVVLVAAAIGRRVPRVEVGVAEEDDASDVRAVRGGDVALVDVPGDLGSLAVAGEEDPRVGPAAASLAMLSRSHFSSSTTEAW